MKIHLKDPNEFKKLLLMKGFSQRQLADAIEISNPYFNKIVNGDQSPSPGVAKKIVEALRLKFEDIFFISDACKSYQKVEQIQQDS